MTKNPFYFLSAYTPEGSYRINLFICDDINTKEEFSHLNQSWYSQIGFVHE